MTLSSFILSTTTILREKRVSQELKCPPSPIFVSLLKEGDKIDLADEILSLKWYSDIFWPD